MKLCPRISLFASIALLSSSSLLFSQAAAPAAAAPKTSGLPSAQEVIDRYVKAIGGREAVLSHKSYHSKGTFEMPAMGMKGDLEIFAAKPNKVFVKINMPGIGEVLSGYDGKVGWSVNPATGPMLLEGKQLEQMQVDYDFYAVLHDPKNFKSMEVVELTEFEGKKCYKLRLVRNQGQEDFEMFDSTTGMQVGSVVERETPNGAVKMNNVMTEYKKIGGIMVPTKFTQKMLGMEQQMTFSTIEFDTVNESVFDLPASIKTLAAPKAP